MEVAIRACGSILSASAFMVFSLSSVSRLQRDALRGGLLGPLLRHRFERGGAVVAPQAGGAHDDELALLKAVLGGVAVRHLLQIEREALGRFDVGARPDRATERANLLAVRAERQIILGEAHNVGVSPQRDVRRLGDVGAQLVDDLAERLGLVFAQFHFESPCLWKVYSTSPNNSTYPVPRRKGLLTPIPLGAALPGVQGMCL